MSNIVVTRDDELQHLLSKAQKTIVNEVVSFLRQTSFPTLHVSPHTLHGAVQMKSDAARRPPCASAVHDQGFVT